MVTENKKKGEVTGDEDLDEYPEKGDILEIYQESWVRIWKRGKLDMSQEPVRVNSG